MIVCCTSEKHFLEFKPTQIIIFNFSNFSQNPGYTSNLWFSMKWGNLILCVLEAIIECLANEGTIQKNSFSDYSKAQRALKVFHPITKYIKTSSYGVCYMNIQTEWGNLIEQKITICVWGIIIFHFGYSFG